MKKLFIYAWITCLLISCTEKITDSSLDEEQQYPFISIEIALDDTEQTKADSSDPYEKYFPGTTDNEKSARFYNAMFAIFDKYNMLVHYQLVNYYPNFIDNTNMPSEDKYAFLVYKQGERMTTGLHYFYALFNVPTTMFNQLSRFEEGKVTVEEFESEVLSFPAVDYIFRDHNATKEHPYSRGFFMTNRERVTANLVATTGMSAPPAENTVYIYLTKAIGKVSLAYIPEEEKEINGKLEDIEFKVVNNPNRMYMNPQLNQDETDFLTPHYYNTTFDSSLFNCEPAHDYKPATTKTYPLNENGDPDKSNMSITYCIENNNLKALQGNSTMLLIKTNFIPHKWANPNSQKFESPEYIDNITPEAKTTFTRIRKKDTQEYLPGYYKDIPVISDTNLELITYENGICYYPFWLNDGIGYRVKRNNYYRVLITGVTDAGAPDEDKTIEPEKPIKGAIAGLQIKVLDWETQNQNENLEGDNKNPFN